MTNKGNLNLKKIKRMNLENKMIQVDSLQMMKEMEGGSVDMIFTDPPYNAQGINWDKKDDEWQFQWLEEAKRILKIGGSFYMFFAPLNMYGVEGWIRENLNLKNTMVWWHRNLYASGMSFGQDRWKSTWEIIFYAVKGDKAKHGQNIQKLAFQKFGRSFDVMDDPQPRPLLHKAQKPINLCKKIILCSTEKDDIVFDPFCGVGTICLAAKMLGRKFIGLDIEEAFVKFSNLRLENIQKLKMIDKAILQEYGKEGILPDQPGEVQGKVQRRIL